MGERLDVLDAHVSEAINYALHVIQAIVVDVRIHSIKHRCPPTILGPLTMLSPLSTVLFMVTSLSPVYCLLHRVSLSSLAAPFPLALSTSTLIVH